MDCKWSVFLLCLAFVKSEEIFRTTADRTNESQPSNPSAEIRVIDEEGTQLGVMTPGAAIGVAEERGLDLVEVAPNGKPPVCRIMDYGKYRYQMKRKAHEARKHQKSITVKEVKFRPNTDEHDYEFKKNHIIRFLNQGDKVKANVWFRGREIVHKEIGRALIQRLVEELEDIGNCREPAQDGRQQPRRHLRTER